MFMETNINVSMTAVHAVCMTECMDYISVYFKLPMEHKQTLPARNFNENPGPTFKSL